ncbi:SDR family NAD(P)-dependent oxidoreductase [Mammaliicoccus lentus]|uniref:SDR family NAD(P)-dependent oxidoreductase n=1 Tax=Mammaliicoccus lentus TaxID=42858 RepID=UPI002DBB111E|nr:SDR family NAD(P)-dependent oxidoreductase [Mammaliicoccus lentus]MEB8092862.1 SDR family NAD(P)-dependent oxidoreductase [Mammaliicoccus lentus]
MKQCVENLEQHKGNIFDFKCNVSDAEQVKNTIKERFGRIDILINSASIALLDDAENND